MSDEIDDLEADLDEARKALKSADDFLTKVKRLENSDEFKALLKKDVNLGNSFRDAKGKVEKAYKRIK